MRKITILSFFYGLLFSIVIASTDDCPRAKIDLNPFSHLYVNNVLAHLRQAGPRTSQLLLEVNSDGEDLRLPVAGIIPFPWTMIDYYIETVTHLFLRSSDGRFLSTLNNSAALLDQCKIIGTRFNVTVGHIYQYPFYFRMGIDYMPFGRHTSTVIPPSMMVTRYPILPNAVGSAGFDYRYSNNQQWHVAAAGGKGILALNPIAQTNYNSCIEYKFFILNACYQKASPTALGWIYFKNLQLGGGIGIKTDALNTQSTPSLLLNLNSDIDFAKYYNCKFEYVLDNKLKTLGIMPVAFAVHMELSKNFPTVPVIGGYVPGAITGGYEMGPQPIYCNNDITHINLVSNLFLAGKVELWQKQMTLMVCAKWSFYDYKPRWLLKLSGRLL
jgi:hypothetical protein